MDVTTDIPMELRRRLTYATFLDVGKGAEKALDIQEITLRKAVRVLIAEGYKLFYLGQTQEGTLRHTTIRVLGRPNTTYGEVLNNRDKIEKIFMTLTLWLDAGWIVLWLIIIVIMANKGVLLITELAAQLALPAEHQVRNSPYRGPYFNQDKVNLAKEKYNNHLKWMRLIFIVELINIVTLVFHIINHT